MLRGVPFKSAARAHDYYTQALVKEDYWSKGAAVAGLFHGKAMQRLGVEGEVKSKDFEALANNRHPVIGEKITVRDRPGRIVGMDMSFGVPKSISILYAFTGDEQISELVMMANQKMMNAIERDATTQVRRDGKIEDRVAGNLAYATFLHHTSRPVGGIPDPHLHTHNFVFNLTFDTEEERFKALKFRVLKQNAPLYEAIGRSWLAWGLREVGYDVRKVGKSFEIVGIPRTLIQKYSRRTMEIERLIAEKGIKGAAAKDRIGARSREAKKASLSPQQTLEAWKVRLDEDENKIIRQIVQNRGQVKQSSMTPKDAVDFALAHCFDKKSVAKTRDVFREAVAHGYGTILPDDVIEEIDKRNLIRGTIKGVEYCTTKYVLGEEAVMLEWARNGKGIFPRFVSQPYKVSREFLSDEQIKATKEILYSHNQVIGLQGSSGVGKTTLMQEVVEAIGESGKHVFAFAPTAKAAEKLKEDGFANAMTLASLLTSDKFRSRVRGQVIWVDEAGLIGVEDMVSLFGAAGKDTRILLSGDVHQHSPVSRGDAFRLLQETGILRCSVVNKIIRQKSGYYRDAAQALANGDVEAAFGYLQAMDAFAEIQDSKQRYRILAKKYVESFLDGDSPFLLCPTHAESGKVTSAVRKRLHELNIIGSDRELTRLVDLRWSDAEKLKCEAYQAGMVVEFHQNAKNRIVRGSRFTVQDHDEMGQVVVADSKGRIRSLNLSEASKYTVYRKLEISLARGDLIRMTKNGYLSDGRRFNNGQSYGIARIYPSGSLKLNNGALVKADYGHIRQGYVSTSYSSQSQTISGPIFIAQNSASSGANSLNQFYVSLTRGKSKAWIFTDSIEELQENVRQKENRITALEFLRNHSTMAADEESRTSMTPYDIPEKQHDVVFNEVGEYRHTVGFIRHEIGGNFADYVEYRRRNFAGVSDQLIEARQAYLNGDRELWDGKILEKRKVWNQNLEKQRGISSAVNSNENLAEKKAKPVDWRGRIKIQKKDWSKTLSNRRDEIISGAKGGKKPVEAGGVVEKKTKSIPKTSGKGMSVNRSDISKKKSKAPAQTKKPAKPKNRREQIIAKAKGKGKSKSPLKPPPPPPKIVIKK